MPTIAQRIKLHQKKLIDSQYCLLINKVSKEIFNIDLNEEQLAYTYSLLKINNLNREQNSIKITNEIQVPVQYLFTSMTGFDSEDYEKTASNEYMANVTRTCIKPLNSIVKATGYYKNYCRKFIINNKLLNEIDTHIESIFNSDGSLVIESNKHKGKKPAKWAGYCLLVQHIPTLTKTAWYKLRDSQFKFDINTFNSSEGKSFNNSLNMNKYQRRLLMQSLSNILMSPEPQYPNSFSLQEYGRLYTKGGTMNLNSLFRRHYIKPIDSNNYVLEVNIKCVQLLALCNLLNAQKVKKEILAINNKDSIWNYIGSSSIPKEIKKVIVYGFCFGASLNNLPYLATYRGDIKHNFNYSITKKEVEQCFTGILQPLIELRDVWMNKYSITNIESNNIDRVIHTNALGMKLNLNKELSLYKKEIESKKNINNLKVAARLMAFYTQASEQLIIQSLLAQDCISNNILTYSYDGFSLETPQPETVLNNMQSYLFNNFSGWNLDYQIYN